MSATMTYEEYRLKWFATMIGTALERDEAEVARVGSHAAADLRAGLREAIQHWTRGYRDCFTDEELALVYQQATEGLAATALNDARRAGRNESPGEG